MPSVYGLPGCTRLYQKGMCLFFSFEYIDMNLAYLEKESGKLI